MRNVEPSARDSRGARSLQTEVLRAYGGLIGGLLGGLGLEAISGQYDPLHGVVAIYVAPLAFTVLIFQIGARDTPLSSGRVSGACAGWLGMWIIIGALFDPAYQSGGSGLVLAALAVLFLTSVPAGMILGDWIQTRTLASRPTQD